MKILLVDTLSELGHIKFNQSIADWLANEDVTIYFSESMARNFDLDSRSFSDRMLAKDSKWRYKFNQIVLMKNILSTLRNNSFDKVLFLSYEPLSMFFLSHFIRHFTHANIFVVEHNTVPNTGFFKKMLYKMISNTITHITLMDYISKYVSDKFNKKTATVRHPMKNIFDSTSEGVKAPSIDDKIIFMPSATIDADTTNKIFRIVSQNKKYTLYAKPNYDVKFESENIILSSRFDDYNRLMASSDVVIIPQDFDYRVSGVLYEALQSNALIIVSDCIFGQFASEYFPDRVLIVSDWSELFPLIESNLSLGGGVNKGNYFSEWNKRGKHELYEALNAND
ncbi:TPA: hypothetical protein ACKP1B_000190 [Serratia fonticola]